MFLPKIKFIEMPIDSETNIIHWFLFKDWRKYIIKKHPQIKKIYALKKKSDQIKFLKKYIKNFRKLHKKEITEAKEKYQKIWKKIEKDYYSLLQKIMKTSWPKDKKQIKAMISINPICPRFLDNWSFSIFFKYKKPSHAMEVIMHEICHFLYFKKWKEIFPSAKRKTFDYPNTEWLLSELVAPIILNDKQVQKYLKQRATFYPEHQKIKIGSRTAPKYFTDLYKKYIKENNSFEIFLKEAYKDINQYRNRFILKNCK